MTSVLSALRALKKLMVLVHPGVLLVCTRRRRPITAFISVLLPTLERPANAISCSWGGGSCSSLPAAATNCASTIRILDGSTSVITTVVFAAQWAQVKPMGQILSRIVVVQPRVDEPSPRKRQAIHYFGRCRETWTLREAQRDRGA